MVIQNACLELKRRNK